MNVVALSAWDLATAALLVLALGGLSVLMQIGIERQLLIAASRTVVQLLLVGLVLKVLFAAASPLWIALMGAVMLLVAAREISARLNHRLDAHQDFTSGLTALGLSCVSVLLLTLLVIIDNQPWYAPRYAIPIFGMLLGNCMTGIALAMNTLIGSAINHRAVIEQRLALGASYPESIATFKSEAVRTAMIPTINAMAAAGIVALPGMMTGQILAGTTPVEAVKYQILVMFLIAASTGFGVLLAVWMTIRRLFDDRHRLRLDRLAGD